MNWSVLGVAFGVTLVTTPLVARTLSRRGRMDYPNVRSSHSVAVPRGGGIACAAGVAGGMAVAGLTFSSSLLIVVAVILTLTVVGYVDDRASLSSWMRLLAQALAGALLGVTMGLGWILIAVGTVLVVVNCVNFMDGINGITSLTMLAWGGAALVVAQAHEVTILSVLGGVTAAAAVGFLPWNAPTARIFLGDVGSYLFGALVATGVVVGVHAGVPAGALLGPLAVYLFDVGLTLAHRLYRRAPVMRAHREHIYQRLVAETGRSHLHVAGYVFALTCIVTAGWLALETPRAAVLTIAVLFLYAWSVPIGRWVNAQTSEVRSMQ